MKSFKVIATIITAAAMMAAVTTTTYADSIYDTAEYIELGEPVEEYISEWLADGDTLDYCVEVTKGGALKVNFSGDMDLLNITIYDADGNEIYAADCNMESGEDWRSHGYGLSLEWNKVVERIKGCAYYSVARGEYYIRIESANRSSLRTDSGSGGDLEFMLTMAPVKGDVDENGAVNALDAAAILRNIVNGKSMDSYIADFNQDGNINSMDAAAILKYVVGD